MPKLQQIISGGQTGADRAAFDFALEHNIQIGGFVPKGRVSEDGGIPAKYKNLTETDSEDPALRTALNVRNADATLIVSRGALKGGSKLTAEIAKELGKPYLCVDLGTLTIKNAARKARRWLASIECAKLNVAGARASEDGRIYSKTKKLLTEIFRDE